MSKIWKGIKSVGKWVKKNWKTIVIVAAIVFTAGIATVGLGAYTAAVGSSGFWAATGSTMWAGATSIAGTVGIGSGASGSVAAASGMQGATLLTGAGAQAAGLASAGAGGGGASAAVGTYTGPGSSFMGGGGSVFGGGAGKTAATTQAAGTTAGAATTGSQTAGAATGSQAAGTAAAGSQAGGGGLLSGVAQAATPALITGAGQYFMAKGAEEAERPRAMWGVDFDGGESYLPDDEEPSRERRGAPRKTTRERFTGEDGHEYEVGEDGIPRRVSRTGRVSAPPIPPWLHGFGPQAPHQPFTPQQPFGPQAPNTPSVSNPVWQGYNYGGG